MVVGDIITDVGADNAVLDFQPAAGVEVMITMVNEPNQYGPFDGANLSLTVANTSFIRSLGDLKMGITNAVFLRITAPGVGLFNAFSGIEIG